MGGAMEENLMANTWDFDTINQVVPIEEVLAMHGIQPMRGKVRLRTDDDTPSAHVYKGNNTVYDFGLHNSFNPLTLTMYLQGLNPGNREDWKKAAQILGETFHIPPKYTDKDNASGIAWIADYEWKKIGIHPDMASKNIDFHLDRRGITEKMMQIAQRYQMPMSELRELVIAPKDVSKVEASDKGRYESILLGKAIPYAAEKRDEYFRRMYDDYESLNRLGKAMKSDMGLDKMYQMHQSDYAAMADELTAMEAVLKKAIEGTRVKYTFRNYYPERDFKDVVAGKIPFEIGPTSRYDVRDAAFWEKGVVFETVVLLDVYWRLMDNGLGNVQCAAKQMGDQVKLYFKSSDAGRMNYLVKTLRGKEDRLAEYLGEALGKAQNEKDVIAQKKDAAQVRQGR